MDRRPIPPWLRWLLVAILTGIVLLFAYPAINGENPVVLGLGAGSGHLLPLAGFFNFQSCD